MTELIILRCTTLVSKFTWMWSILLNNCTRVFGNIEHVETYAANYLYLHIPLHIINCKFFYSLLRKHSMILKLNRTLLEQPNTRVTLLTSQVRSL